MSQFPRIYLSVNDKTVKVHTLILKDIDFLKPNTWNNNLSKTGQNSEWRRWSMFLKRAGELYLRTDLICPYQLSGLHPQGWYVWNTSWTARETKTCRKTNTGVPWALRSSYSRKIFVKQFYDIFDRITFNQ